MALEIPHSPVGRGETWDLLVSDRQSASLPASPSSALCEVYARQGQRLRVVHWRKGATAVAGGAFLSEVSSGMLAKENQRICSKFSLRRGRDL